MKLKHKSFIKICSRRFHTTVCTHIMAFKCDEPLTCGEDAMHSAQLFKNFKIIILSSKCTDDAIIAPLNRKNAFSSRLITRWWTECIKSRKTFHSLTVANNSTIIMLMIMIMKCNEHRCLLWEHEKRYAQQNDMTGWVAGMCVIYINVNVRCHSPRLHMCDERRRKIAEI